MAEHRNARPVSGEIMTGSETAGAPELRLVAADIVDADYEVLPRVVPREEAAPASERGVATPSIEGMGMLRKPETASVRPSPSRGGPIFWIAGVGAALAAFWVSGGHAVVRQTPFWTAQPAGAVLSLAGVTSRVDTSGVIPVLFVDGEAVNDGIKASPLPPLEIRVTGNDRRITRYTLGTSNRSLAPGERFGFSSRLDAPRTGVKAVAVVFAG